MNKSYRIHTNISQDKVLNVNMRQDFDFLEVLSLQLSQEDAYRLHASNYGVIVGRVLANDAFGIPNAKISVFIAKDGPDDKAIEALYPYASVNSKDKEGRRYNLLPDSSDDECYRVVGTFPSKTLVLNDDTNLEVFDKYYRYTTVTNQAGDYMIFGVPTGTNEIHVDIDLSDIGVLSQKPRDFEYKGYNINLFDNANQFKESTNLDSLPQIISQNKTVNVYPFWCDEDENVAAITRCDIDVQYKFEPTCVFMGSIMTDNDSNAIGHDCRPAKKSGMNNQLVTGEGTIEMIRKTPDGMIEEFQIKGNQLIDSDGVWCYQIPMNLDFIGTDEYGNIVPTDNPSKGIPTRTQVRFRISKTESPGGSAYHTAKMLVPMNPAFDETKESPTINVDGNEIEQMYQFGSATPLSCFRDLYWNNVYSVKSYIPRIQNRIRIPISEYNALKGSNLADDQNQVPFNKLRVDVPFSYLFICILYTIVMWVVTAINTVICGINAILKVLFMIMDLRIPIIGVRPFRWIRDILNLDYLACIPLSVGPNDDNIAYYPGCSCTNGKNKASCPDDMPNCKKVNDNEDLIDQVQRNLALDYDIIKLDFYNDWLNGALYMPLWYWKKSRKKKFLFFTIKNAQDTFCNCNKNYGQLRNAMSCAIGYRNANLGVTSSQVPEGQNKWHKQGAAVQFKHGVIKEVQNKDGLSIYYYVAVEAAATAKDPTMAMGERVDDFDAVRLYATDIILLGNLDKDNIYGIPQFYKNLPSTTANIPPIATTKEIENESDGTDDNNTIPADVEGSVTTTGMDWGHDGGSSTPRYKNGLFMDLACTYVNTKAKACINAERMSEYGVNLDMSYSMPYHSSNVIRYGEILPDGFINKLEMDSMDERAAFATMNHNGFIPQAYQESASSYTTQVADENTNYLVPKFTYLYPTNLDGRMNAIMQSYNNGFVQGMSDEIDEDYLTFRLGAKSSDYKRLRHLYNAKASYGNNLFAMPLYNNSYYFFFGINKGNTAIDKFNKMFDAQCFQNKLIPFALVIDKQVPAVCPESYPSTLVDYAYPYIKVSLGDIETPYAYTLYDAKGNMVVSEGDMTDNVLIISGFIEGNGKIHPNTGSSSILSDQVYKLVVTDANGRSVKESIDMSYQYLSFSYTSTDLGAKYYDNNKTPREYICGNGFNGQIVLDGVVIDGYNMILSGETTGVTVNPTNIVINGFFGVTKIDTECYITPLTILVKTAISGDSTNDYMCQDANGKADVSFVEVMPASTSATCSEDAVTKIVMNVYRPSTYVVTIMQNCNGVASRDNSSDVYVTINNGKDFKAFVNTMPLEFMTGTQQNIDGTSYTKSKFYANSVATSVTDVSISGWLYPYTEESYIFPSIISAGEETWENYINFYDLITSPDSLREIITKKFEWMFALTNGVFLTNDYSGILTMTTEGGIQPVLYRMGHPDYTDYCDDGDDYMKFIIDDTNTVSCSVDQPNIIGTNSTRLVFDGDELPEEVIINTEPGFSFNSLLYDSTNPHDSHVDRWSAPYIGNFMAAFTNDAGYSSNTAVDDDKKYQAAPWQAVPNENGNIKPKSRTITGNDTILEYMYETAGQQYLRGFFVDRRFDYDLIMIGPVLADGFTFDSNMLEKAYRNWLTVNGYVDTDNNLRTFLRGRTEYQHYLEDLGIRIPNDTVQNAKDFMDNERQTYDLWKNARLFGKTYNGIELSYDDDYNIISAKTYTDETGEVVSAKTNASLEYTYRYTGGVVLSPITSVNYRPTKGRKPYGAYVNDVDLLNLSPNENVPGAGFPLNKYELSGDTSGNTDYQQGIYPTVRELNVFLPPEREYTFTNVACSYNIKPYVENGNIFAITQPGETTEITFPFDNIIQFVNETKDGEEDLDYGNIEMISGTSPSQSHINNLYTFGCKDIDFSFKIGNRDCGFEVYHKLPYILPLSSQNNPILEIKRRATDYTSLTEVIEEECISFGDSQIATECPEGYSVGQMEGNDNTVRRDGNHDYINGEWYVWNNSTSVPVPSSDAGFLNTIFRFDGEPSDVLPNTKFFTVLLDEDWFYTSPDGLKRCIRVIEFGEPYDIRPISVSAITGTRIVRDADGNDVTSASHTGATGTGEYIETTLKFALLPNSSGETNDLLMNISNLKRLTVLFKGWYMNGSIMSSITFTAKGIIEKEPVAVYDGTQTINGIGLSVTVGKSDYERYGYDMMGENWHNPATSTASGQAMIALFIKTKSGCVYQLGSVNSINMGMDVRTPGLSTSDYKTLTLHLD